MQALQRSFSTHVQGNPVRSTHCVQFDSVQLQILQLPHFSIYRFRVFHGCAVVTLFTVLFIQVSTALPGNSAASEGSTHAPNT